MKFLLAIFLAFIVSTESDAAELTNKLFLNVTSCFSNSFADFNSWVVSMGAVPRNKVNIPFKSEFPELNELKKQYENFKTTAICEYFDYKVGDILVRGYYLAPKVLISNLKLPLIINNRGGNRDFGFVSPDALLHSLFPLVKEGFVIVGSQYRGFIKNIPNSGVDEFGGRDLEDVLKLIDLAPYYPKVDSKKIGMLGGSRGGMMAYMVAKKSDHVSAIAVVSGVTNLHKLMAFRPEMETVYKELIPNYASEKDHVLNERSAIGWADKINKNIPILILHGANDERVNVNDALDMARVLSAIQHPYKLVIYENEDHFLSKHQSDVIKELSAWFKEKLN